MTMALLPGVLIGLLSLASSFAVPAASIASPALGTEADFEASLKLVEKTMGPGRWKKAKELLLASLEANKDERFILYHAFEIERAMKLCTFSLEHEAPEPEACVSGELAAYSASSGQIDIRYRNDPSGRKAGAKMTGKARSGGPAKFEGFSGYSFDDFTKSGTTIFHPINFEGPFTIEIEGKSYPRINPETGPPFALVCLDWGQAYLVSAGTTASGGYYANAMIGEWAAGEMEIVDRAEPRCVPGSPFRIKIAVASGQITLYEGNDKVVNSKKAPTAWGGIAFSGFPEGTSISLKGKAQPSFVQGAIDAAVQKQWAEFEKSYDAKTVLPAWFIEKTKEREAPPDIADISPGKDHAANRTHLERVKTLLDKDDLTEEDVGKELTKLRETKAEEITEELRQWLWARLCHLLGKPSDALTACDSVRKLDPTFVPARLLRAELLDELGRRSEAMYECEQAILELPDKSGPYEALAGLLLREDKPDAARVTLRGAIDAGIPANELSEINGTLLRCVKGPSWTKVYEYKSEHYHVSSDISQEICFKAATQLEKFYRKYNARFERVAKGGAKRLFRVFLFSGQEGYLSYTDQITGFRFESTNGVYSPVVKQLLIWNLPDNADMLRTIRHEGFHQYLDQIVKDAPRWLNEGMAEYFEGSKLVKGNWSDGELNVDRMETLRGGKLTPLKEFLYMTPSRFMDSRRVGMNYAQAWIFVHFLMESGGEYKKRFEKLFDALVGGAKANEAVEKAFGDADFATLDREFREYVEGLL